MKDSKEKASRGTEKARTSLNVEKSNNYPQRTRKAHRGKNNDIPERGTGKKSLAVLEKCISLRCLVKLLDTKYRKNMKGRKDPNIWSSLDALYIKNLIPTRGENKKPHSTRAAFRLLSFHRTR